MKRNFMLVGAALALSACTTAPQPSQPVTADPVNVTIVGVNDFHGNLLPTDFRIPDPNDRTKTVSVKAGGIEAIGGVLGQIRAQNPNTVFVGVGDMTGGSPLISGLLRDEPTIKALTGLGMQVNVLGNHEFDYGLAELQRFQKGGCASNEPTRACKFENTFAGAGFTYIAANVVDEKTGARVFPAYKMVKVGGVNVAFVGAVLRDTPTVVTPSGVAGLRFEDEAAAINRAIPALKFAGADAIVALIHQGGTVEDTQETFDVADCKTLGGAIVNIARTLDPAISAVMTGHTHRGYNCRVPGPDGQERIVIQGDAYGHLLQRLDLRIDPARNRVLDIKAQNVLVNAAVAPKDPAMTAIVQKARAITDPIAAQPVATLGVEQITRTQNAAGESALGNVIADAQLAATRAPEKGGAVIALMNPGGIRADLPVSPNPSRTVSYGDVFTVQPFGNTLTVITLTGAQIKAVLEQQFGNPEPGRNRILQVSQGFAYTWDNSRPRGEKVTSITLNGQVLDPAANYRVTVNSFLAEGGDNFTVFAQGTGRTGGDLDLDALQNYLRANTVTPGPLGRITRLN